MSHEDYPDAGTLDERVRLHDECSTNPYGWQRWVMDQIAPHLRGRVLEVGTGPGYLWIENASRLLSDFHLVLSDRSKGMLNDASTRLAGVGVTADWILCDVNHLPFQGLVFDTVIANHVLFLLEEPAKGVHQLARCLRPGGMLFATTNHRDHLQRLMDLFIELSEDHFGHLQQREISRRRERFNFVSGAEYLIHQFVDLKLVTYEDGLEIDRAEILVPWLDYWAKPALSAQLRSRLLVQLEEQIARKGVLRIHKNSGMFIARKGD